MSTVQEFDFNVELMKCLLWQHDNAEALKTLLRKKQDWYSINQAEFWDSWYRDVFNLDTADAFGLSVWARILNVPLQVRIAADVSRPAFGFGVNHLNFNNGNFARGREGDVGLTVEQSRMVLKLRYFQLVSRGAIPEINEWLHALFADIGNVYAIDNHDMTMTYFFTFEPDSSLKFIFEKYDILPRPAGVELKMQTQVRPSFGFGVHHLNFNNGSFGD